MSQFAEGQVWAYETRAKEPGSRVEILKVEREGDGEIVHVRLVGLRLAHFALVKGYAEEVDHAAITGDALAASVTERMLVPAREVGPIPEYYAWREQYELGETAPFTLRLKDLVATIEAGLNDILGDDPGLEALPEDPKQVN